MTATSASAIVRDDSDLTLKDVIRSLPREFFEKNVTKAWTQVALNVFLVGLGYASIAFCLGYMGTASAWYLLPLCWVFTGTALTGFFVIGHDCGHRSFSNKIWVNDLVGHIAMMPLIYPLHSWRILHDKHHKHTNKMDVDNAWQPFRPSFYDNEMSGIERAVYKMIRGRLWWMGSIFHWGLVHFNKANYSSQKDWKKARFSNTVVILGAAIGFPILILNTGMVGWASFWLMPWLVYHFWMSTFTIVHHTIPEIPFQEPEVWNEAEAQLFGTVHCEYPAWVEVFCHHINVHIPHHVSTAIPSYNLRAAHNYLKGIWGDRMIERNFNWALMKQITDQCHLYHPEDWYQTFSRHERKGSLN
jgi:acyl-lipid omega-6 desaturase (Delta-12 desaturase)